MKPEHFDRQPRKQNQLDQTTIAPIEGVPEFDAIHPGENQTAWDAEAEYWNAIAQHWQASCPQPLWRAHSNATNIALLQRWLYPESIQSLLKTDLFDEACSDGLYPFLQTKSAQVTGIDLSSHIVQAAKRRYPKLNATLADARHLPFANHQFETIVSNSTLDHFQNQDELILGLQELHRVLATQGQLILTLDNLANPVIAVRNALPFTWLHWLGILPYYVGVSCTPKQLRQLLEQIGFEVVAMEAMLHCPRVLAVKLAEVVSRAPLSIQQHFLQALMAFERLATLPTSYLTGHFIAVNAIKR